MIKHSSILKFDEKQLAKKLADLPHSIRVAFATACAERLRPHYAEYHSKTGAGDLGVLERGLSLIWADLMSERSLSKHGLKELITECEAQHPDESKPWILEANFAEDAVASIMYALECRETGDAQAAAWAARRVDETIYSYLSNHYNLDVNDPEVFTWILEHPLTQAELHRQQRDLAELETSVASFEMIRNRARAESTKLFDEQSAQQYLDELKIGY